MDQQRPRRSVIVPVAIAIMAWSAAIFWVGSGTHIKAILPYPGKPKYWSLVGWDQDSHIGAWPELTAWIPGMVVILAAGYLFAGGRRRLEASALVAWSIGSALVAALVSGGDIYCETSDIYTNCYTTVHAGGPAWLATWLVGSLVIVGVGHVLRRGGPMGWPRKTQLG